MRDSWKESYAYIPALVIVIGLLPVAWFLPSTYGYLLATTFVTGFLLLAMKTQRISIVQWPVLVGFGIYWAMLLIHYGVTQQLSVIPYVVLVPIAILSLMMVAPPVVERDPTRFATGIVVTVTGIVAIGFLLLLLHVVGVQTPSMTGRRVLGLVDLRVASVYDNSNHFGFVAAIGTLTGYYIWLETRRRIWIVTTLFIAGGLLMSNARMAVLTTALAITIMSIESHQQLSKLVAMAMQSGRQQRIVLPVGVVAIFAVGITVLEGFITEAIESLLLRIEIWATAMTPIVQNPFIGAAFGESLGLHNTYLEIVFQTGVIGGLTYLFALLAACWYSFRRAIIGNRWDRYVFAILLTLMLTHLVETSTVGGLSTESLLFALFIGLAASDGEFVFKPKRMKSRLLFQSGLEKRTERPDSVRDLTERQIVLLQQRVGEIRTTVAVERQPTRAHSLGKSRKRTPSRKARPDTPSSLFRADRAAYEWQNSFRIGHASNGNTRKSRPATQRNFRSRAMAKLQKPFRENRAHSLKNTSEQQKITQGSLFRSHSDSRDATLGLFASLVQRVFASLPVDTPELKRSKYYPMNDVESSPLSATGSEPPSGRSH